MKRKVEKSDDVQLRMHREKREVNINQCKNDIIKRWIYNTKEFEKRMEKTKINDIRRYFEIQNK